VQGLKKLWETYAQQWARQSDIMVERHIRTIKITPPMLLTGREMRIPVDLMFGRPADDSEPSTV